MQTVRDDDTAHATAASPAAPGGTRRTLLATLGAAAAAASGGAATASPEPDAEVLRAWREYVDGWKLHDGPVGAGWTDEENEAHFAYLDRIEERIIATPARTAAGLAAKLRLAFASRQEEVEAHKRVILDAWRLDDLVDWRDRVIASAIRDADRMAGGI